MRVEWLLQGFRKYYIYLFRLNEQEIIFARKSPITGT